MKSRPEARKKDTKSLSSTWTTSGQLVQCKPAKTGEHIIVGAGELHISGAGELHLEICLKDLREDFMKGAEIVVSEPIVSYSETITEKSGTDGTHPEICVSKSPNKHYRIYLTGQSLSEEFVTAVDEGDIQPGNSDVKGMARMLAGKYGWDLNDGRKIWTFGCPPDCIPNGKSKFFDCGVDFGTNFWPVFLFWLLICGVCRSQKAEKTQNFSFCVEKSTQTNKKCVQIVLLIKQKVYNF